MNYLAIDLGAENGRVVLGSSDDGKLTLREIYRFKNEMVFKNGHLRWNIENIFIEIKKSLKIIAAQNIKLSGMGIDTWGVDFGFIDVNGNLAEDPISYRDSRTDGVMEKVFAIISKEEIYKQTGIQFLPFNTLYQLYTAANNNPKTMNYRLAFIPDILNYLLTGKLQTESTIASTSQLLSATGAWASEIFIKLNLAINIMPEVKTPGSLVGEINFADELKELNGTSVFAVGSHDTASAVAAVPVGDNEGSWAFLSSGTWSLMGVELQEPIINTESLAQNFTNEKGVFGTYRFLKNIPGFWLMQQCKKHWPDIKSYNEINALAEKAEPFQSLINVNHESFLHPTNMLEAIIDFCVKTNQPIPQNPGEFARCILESLALEYKKVIGQLESITNKKITNIYVVGGGSQNNVLNQMLADASQKTIIAGPAEATALGNIIVQAIANKEFTNIQNARKIIKQSFILKTYEPKNQGLWDKAFLRYTSYYGL